MIFNLLCIIRDTVLSEKNAKKSIFYIERKLLGMVAS
jgi:hypothetical protein